MEQPKGINKALAISYEHCEICIIVHFAKILYNVRICCILFKSYAKMHASDIQKTAGILFVVNIILAN